EEIKPDIVQIEQPYLFILSKILRKVNSFKKVCVVLDEHNVEFLAMKKPNTLLLLPYVKYAEKTALNMSDVILVTSVIDKQLLIKLYHVPKEKIFVIPNCIDISKYDYKVGIDELRLRIKRVTGFDNIAFFHGTLSYYPNYEAANIIIKKIAPIIKECLFIIAGKDCPYSLIRKAKRVKNVRVLGYIKEVEKLLAICDIYVAPILRGSGTRVKIIEAMAAGCPIVATYKAVEGLNVRNNIHGLFHENIDEDFIKSIRKLLVDKELAHKLKINVKSFIKKYDWSTIERRLYKVYTQVFKGC
ncbi:MAG: glycosyltransferase family 4 protein, partial [Nitrososphaeria archaeon]